MWTYGENFQDSQLPYFHNSSNIELTYDFFSGLSNSGYIEIYRGDVSTGSVFNTGVIDCYQDIYSDGGGSLVVKGNFVNDGVIVLTADEELYHQAIYGHGEFDLTSASVLNLYGGADGGEKINFVGPHVETLALNHVGRFFGWIKGFGHQGERDKIAVDNYGPGTTFNFIEASSNKFGELNLYHGNSTAHINFTGNYNTLDFVMTNVGHRSIFQYI